MKKYVYLALTACIMVVIFFFSSQNAEQSNEVSGAVQLWIAENIIAKPQLASSYWGLKLIRKLAHLSLYFCLGISMTLTVREWKPKCCQPLWAWLLPTIYACTDEFHQRFVQGRSAQISDVILDSVGVLIGVLFLCKILRLVSKLRKQDGESPKIVYNTKI